MNKQEALIKLATVRLAINHVLRNRAVQKQADAWLDESDMTDHQRRLMHRLRGNGYNVKGPGYDYSPSNPDLYWHELPENYIDFTSTKSRFDNDSRYWSEVGSPGREGLMGPVEWEQNYGTEYIDKPEFLEREAEMDSMFLGSGSRPFERKEPLRQKLNTLGDMAKGMRFNADANHLNYLNYLRDRRTNPKYFD